MNYSYIGYEDINIYRMCTICDLRQQFGQSPITISIRDHRRPGKYVYDNEILDIDKPIVITLHRGTVHIVCNIVDTKRKKTSKKSTKKVAKQKESTA